jgi:hypothetical protein
MGGARLPGAHHRDKSHIQEALADDAPISLFVNRNQVLIESFADWGNKAAAGFELVQELLGDIVRSSRQHDAVKGCCFRPALIAVTDSDLHIQIPQAAEPAGSVFC